jgi:hypothetical protein
LCFLAGAGRARAVTLATADAHATGTTATISFAGVDAAVVAIAAKAARLGIEHILSTDSVTVQVIFKLVRSVRTFSPT